jgi:hypothetical protein
MITAEALFCGLLPAAPATIAIADDAGLVQLVNAQTEVLFCHRQEELLGQSDEGPDDQEAGDAGVRQHSPSPRALAKALIGFAADVRVRILAEGLEEPDQLTVPYDLAASWAQGLLLGRSESPPTDVPIRPPVSRRSPSIGASAATDSQ